MTSPWPIVATRALETLREAYRLICQAKDKTDQARGHLASATEGTANEQVEKPIGKLDGVGRQLDKATGHLISGAELFGDYLMDIGAGDVAVPSAPPSAPAPDPVVRADPVRLADFRPTLVHPDAYARIKESRYPRNTQDNVSARADLYDERGTRLNDETLTPFPYRGGPNRPELKPRWNSPGMTTTWHVESKLARLIRDSPSETLALYLNIPLCGAPKAGREEGHPMGCSENFRHIIPAGKVVYVHVVPKECRSARWKIIGTGEGIE